jgi:hypothetical protein
MVSPNSTNFSLVPDRIPLLICLATIGGLKKHSEPSEEEVQVSK